MLYGRFARQRAEAIKLKRASSVQQTKRRRRARFALWTASVIIVVFPLGVFWSHQILDDHLSTQVKNQRDANDESRNRESSPLLSLARSFRDNNKMTQQRQLHARNSLRQPSTATKETRSNLPILSSKEESKEATARSSDHHDQSTSDTLVESRIGKYILFEHIPFGQGAGNQITGLLASHLLGIEFNRTVCVSKEYDSFHKAFQPVKPDSELHCQQAFDEADQHPNRSVTTKVYTWWGDVNECMLKDLMASDVQFIRFSTNFYPGWAPVEDDFFHKLYKPTKALMRWIPWAKEGPPHTVVHLRHGDNDKDQRKGLDDKSFELLGKMLKGKENDVYLVTNKVDWYTFFQREYQWKHPPWVHVPHSACFWIDWGGAEKTTKAKKPKPWQTNLQLWSDWYTILNAKRVIHTHSDFSLSAIHFANNRNTLTINGVNETTNSLILLEESWIRDGTMDPLSKRDELKFCDKKDYQDGGELLIAKQYQERKKALEKLNKQ